MKIFLNVTSAQFIRNFKLNAKRQKYSAYQKKVMEKSEKATKSTNITFQEILIDKSENKEASHVNLKLNLLKNPKFLDDRKFTKNNLCLLFKHMGFMLQKSQRKRTWPLYKPNKFSNNPKCLLHVHLKKDHRLTCWRLQIPLIQYQDRQEYKTYHPKIRYQPHHNKIFQH
jgi:transcription antitermination factor NusG